MLKYGITSYSALMAIFKTVSRVFKGSSAKTTEELLVGTACAETLLGTFPDAHPEKHGVGLMQMDKIAFLDVQRRTSKHTKLNVWHRFDIDIDTVKHEDLAYRPELSILFARLFYMLIPEPFPTELEEQAKYWKRYYNTEAGKGTPEEYMERLRLCYEKYMQGNTSLFNLKL